MAAKSCPRGALNFAEANADAACPPDTEGGGADLLKAFVSLARSNGAESVVGALLAGPKISSSSSITAEDGARADMLTGPHRIQAELETEPETEPETKSRSAALSR